MIEHGVIYRIKAADTVNKILVNASRNGRQTESQFGKINKQIDRNKGSMLSFNTALSKGNNEFSRWKRTGSDALDKIYNKFQQLKQSGGLSKVSGFFGNLPNFNMPVGNSGDGMGMPPIGMASAMMRMGGIGAGTAAVGAIAAPILAVVAASKLAINTANQLESAYGPTITKYENYEAVLTNTLGTQKASKIVMSDIVRLAKETPETVDTLTDSWMRFSNQGLKPNMYQMKRLVDLNKSTNPKRTITDLAEAVNDAKTGEFIRLREFGIVARKEGDKLSFMFRGQKKIVDNTSSAILEYLVGLGEMNGVLGVSDKMMATHGGKLSNLEDQYDQMRKTIGEKLTPVLNANLDRQSKIAMAWGNMKLKILENDNVVKSFANTLTLLGNIGERAINKLSVALEWALPKMTTLFEEFKNKVVIEFGKLGLIFDGPALTKDQRQKQEKDRRFANQKFLNKVLDKPSIFEVHNKSINPYGDTNTDSSNSSSKKSGLKDSINDLVSGSRDSKHFHINIDSLIKEQNNYMEKLEENPSKIKRIVEQLLMTAIRDVEILEGSR